MGQTRLTHFFLDFLQSIIAYKSRHSSKEPLNPEQPFEPYGGFENLKGYQIAKVIYLATEHFCERFYRDNKRMTDQMVQAARSGVRNISEGSGASGTSRKSEMLLTNVALSRLKAELLTDFEHFLHRNGLQVWDKDAPKTRELRRRLRQRT